MGKNWQDDMKLWDRGKLSIHEIEKRLIAHGLSDEDIFVLLPDLVIMKSLFPEERGIKRRLYVAIGGGVNPPLQTEAP